MLFWSGPAVIEQDCCVGRRSQSHIRENTSVNMRLGALGVTRKNEAAPSLIPSGKQTFREPLEGIPSYGSEGDLS